MATIDGVGSATRGWVMVTGGSQTRTGPHRLYERLAVALSARGDAVIRFDRRGVGDSPGEDRGYRASAPEIACAASALRAHFADLREVRGFGLCDGATALALFGAAAGIGPLALANPWVVDDGGDDLPAAAAIRGYYAARLADPTAWRRLFTGGVNLARLARGIVKGARQDDATLAAQVAAGVPVGSTVILADGDGTAQAFADVWPRLRGAPAVETARVATASHSFADQAGFDALLAALLRR